MPHLRLKKLTRVIFFPMLLTSCAPVIPDNYLAPSTVQVPQKINGKWVSPRLIPISTAMLNTPDGRRLLAPAMKPKPYEIGAYDYLNIIVWGHPELSTLNVASTPIPGSSTSMGMTTATSTSSENPSILVQSDGTIFFPYVGTLKVEGLTVVSAQNAIAKRLARYIRNPQVTIQVAQFRNRKMYVLGEVRAPGLQSLTDKPLTLMEAISLAGGINPSTADPTHIYLVRGSFEKPDIFLLNAQSPQALLIAEQFPLQDGDILYVSGASLNSWNSFINQVLPSFSTYYTIKGLS